MLLADCKPGLFSIDSVRMPSDDFAEVQRKLEATASELRTATEAERRGTLLGEMSRLLVQAERISGQPPKMSHKP